MDFTKKKLAWVVCFVLTQFIVLIFVIFHYITLDNRMYKLIDEHENARVSVSTFIKNFKNKTNVIDNASNFTLYEYRDNINRYIELDKEEAWFFLNKIKNSEHPYDEMGDDTKKALAGLINDIFEINTEQNLMMKSVLDVYYEAIIDNDLSKQKDVLFWLFKNEFNSNQYTILLNGIEFLNVLNNWYNSEVSELKSLFNILTFTILGVVITMVATIIYFSHIIISSFIDPILKASDNIKSGNEVGFLLLSSIITRSPDCHLLFSEFDKLTSKINQQVLDKEKYISEIEYLKRVAEENYLKKSSFLSTMSHEIRTPLNSIIVGLQLIREKSDYNEDLEDILISSEMLMNIVNEILYIDKIDSGEVKLVKDRFSVKELIYNLKSVVEPLSKNKKVYVDILVGDLSNPSFEIDKQKLLQIIINVVNNALIHSESNSLRIRIITDENSIKVKIIDCGVGIEKNKLKTIFSAYKQASTQQSLTTTGLGLAISKKLLHTMKGNIDVWSKINIGTVFTIDVPVHSFRSINISHDQNKLLHGLNTGKYNSRVSYFISKQLPYIKFIEPKDNQDLGENYDVLDIYSILSKESEISSSHTKELEDTNMDLRDIRILVAEDYELNVKLMRKIAKQHMMNFEFASNGQEAIDKIISNPSGFDLIFMDIQMPVMDGLTASKYLKNELEIATPIIGLSANVEVESQEKCLEAGMIAFIQKPFDIKELKSLVLRVVNRNITPS